MRIVETAVKYGLVGLINTAITFIIVFALTIAGFPLVLANAMGFGCGLLNSYFLNKKFTFKDSGGSSVGPFIASFCISYAANLVVLLCVNSIYPNLELVSQFSGMITYNVVFFILMKWWVFNAEEKQNKL